MGAAEDAACIEAVVGKDACGEVAGLAHLANGVDRLVAVDLVEAAAQGG